MVLDAFGNGQPHRLSFRFRDADGDYFTKSAADQPILWSGIWQPVRIPIRFFPTGFDYPVALDGLTIFVGQHSPSQGSTYSGSIFFDNLHLRFNDITHASRDIGSPRRMSLYQNFPNPFNPTTTIRYATAFGGVVRIDLYNVLGQSVRSIMSDFVPAGEHSMTLSSGGLSGGIYFYRLQAGDFSVTRKLVIVK